MDTRSDSGSEEKNESVVAFLREKVELASRLLGEISFMLPCTNVGVTGEAHSSLSVPERT